MPVVAEFRPEGRNSNSQGVLRRGKAWKPMTRKRLALIAVVLVLVVAARRCCLGTGFPPDCCAGCQARAKRVGPSVWPRYRRGARHIQDRLQGFRRAGRSSRRCRRSTLPKAQFSPASTTASRAHRLPGPKRPFSKPKQIFKGPKQASTRRKRTTQMPRASTSADKSLLQN